MWVAEIYANSPDEDGEIYANDVTNGMSGTDDVVYTNDDDEGEMDEEYQNVNEVNNTEELQQKQQPQQPKSPEEARQPIYQNVSRKPTPAPKPGRRNF